MSVFWVTLFVVLYIFICGLLPLGVLKWLSKFFISRKISDFWLAFSYSICAIGSFSLAKYTKVKLLASEAKGDDADLQIIVDAWLESIIYVFPAIFLTLAISLFYTNLLESRKINKPC